MIEGPENMKKRRLPYPGLADDGNPIAFRDVEVESSKNFDPSSARVKRSTQPANLD
jgi:hypothetical protein